MTPPPSDPGSRCHECGGPLDLGLADDLCPGCLIHGLDDGIDEADATSDATATSGLSLPIPGYTVASELARGGMGIVYRARQHAPSREVAIKMLLPFSVASRDSRERFQLEARTLSELDHPAILPIYETGEHDGLPWFSMKLAAGGNLAERAAGLAGRWRDIAELVATLADAVQFAHDRGVLHRDLKPANILFDTTGRPFVADFGLAKLVRHDAGFTRSEHVLGTPHYIAPELASGSAGTATTTSDVYSLGAILFELAAGRPPFEGKSLPELLRNIVERELSFVERSPAPEVADRSVPPGRRPEDSPVPRDLQVITLQCLAKDPARRYASARELAAELRRFATGEPILARPTGPTEKLVRWCRRQPALAAATGGILALLVGLTVVSRVSARRIDGLRLQGLAHLYAADMRLAQQAIVESKYGAAAELLARHLPRPGDPDPRGFEWWHFQDRCRSEESATLEAQSNQVQRVTFSPDGRYLAAGGTEVQVWDFPTRRLILRQAAGEFVWALAFSPDGSRLLAGTGAGSILRFELGPTPRLEATLEHLGSRPISFAWSVGTSTPRIVLHDGLATWDHVAGPITRQAAFPRSFARARVTPIGDTAVVLSGPRNVEAWHLDPPAKIRDFPLPSIGRALDISPDGRRLVAGGYSGTLHLFEIQPDAPVRVVEAHRGLIECVAFSSDGLRMASGGADQIIRLHAVASGLRLGEWQGHRGTILALAFSPDGRWLASGDKLGHVKVWDTATPPPRTEPARNIGATLSDDGARILAMTSVTSLWTRSSTSPPESGKTIVLPGPGSVLASAGALATIGGDGKFRSLEPDGNWREWALGFPVLPGGTVSPDGRFAALRVRGIDGPLVWDFASHGEKFRITNEPSWLNPTFSADSRRLAWGSSRGWVQTWDVPSGRSVASFLAHRNYAYDCDLSPDGSRLVTAGFDGLVKLWDVEGARLLGEYRSTADAYWTVALAPDGRRIAAGTSESSVVLWDVPTGREVATLLIPGPLGPVEGRLRFTPEGGALLRAFGVLDRWNAPGLAEGTRAPVRGRDSPAGSRP